MRETPGSLLRKAREEKKITLKQASEETRITQRHLSAIESDNYSVFPGETYTLGFLRSYASYLEVDPEKVIQLYRGTQLSESEVPLQELTRPPVALRDYLDKYLKPLLLGAVILLLVVTAALLFDREKEEEKVPENQDFGQIESLLRHSANLPPIDTENIKLRSGFSTAVIETGKGINFSVENQEVYLVLLELTSPKEGSAKATFDFYPNKRQIILQENEPYLLEDPILPRKIKLTLIGATPNTAKVQIELENKTEAVMEEPVRTERGVANPDNFIIRLEAVTTGENFVEFFIDGKPAHRGQLAAGKEIFYEANDSIQMKIGDAGAIVLKINGKIENLGRKGNTACKIYRKVRDPVEQTKFRVEGRDC
ncbi:MAG: helix-turn-helix domain-containing protein [Leptospiraceae bacterium]|nr:helix-turn-helix domain-containing protein [Leptospiraceae bacterium]MDW8306275.1 helix-turn-helix domain-containing protein [Leptospiraceae bacterium]